jgi:flagellar hook capping protein FlgD/ASPM-SPD-2-Hydin domain-containing protein
MNKSIVSILTLVLFIPIILFAGEKPQTMIEKSAEKSIDKSEQFDAYSLTKHFSRYNAKLSTSTLNPSKATFLIEGFEGTFPPAGWTMIDSGAGFVQTDLRFHSGDSSAYHNDDSGQQDDWMVTPAVDLTGSVDARLTFYQNNNYDTYYVYHGVYVTTDTTGIMGDTTAWDLVYDGVALNGAWEQIIIDLSAYDGLTVYVGFYYSGDFADEWYIDDVIIEDAPVDPVMVTLNSELNAPTTAVGDTATTQIDEIALLVNSGGGDLTISSITIDNPDFSFITTTSIVAPGDTLFGTASFHPTVSGLITGTMIISGDDPTNPSDTVLVSGVGYPASYILEELDNWVFTPVYFSRIDNNADANEWGWFRLISGTDTNFVAGIPWAAPQNDDYLITPAFEVQSGDFISFDSWVYNASYPETWQVLVSTTDNLAASFTVGLDTVTSVSQDPVNYTYDLSAFTGNTIYITIRNVSADMYYQFVDNIIMPAPVGIVKLNEVYYDSPGSDTHTFTELFGTPGMNLDGFSLEGVNGNGGTTTDVIDLTGNSVPADGFFVIGQDAGVDNVDLIDSDVDFQNGPDNVVLINGVDTVDALGYGNFSSAVFVGEGNPAEDVFSGVSLNRFPDGDDTDDNATDFLGAYPTAGVSNNAPHPIIGGGSSVGFDSVMIGSDSTRNYTIYNNGSADLVVSSIVISNPDFTVDWSDSVIAVGASAGLAVTFTPSDTVVYADSMIIVNNDPLNGARAVSLSGVGYGTPVVTNDLNLTFEDASDIPNWSHWDETNFFTTEAWDATGGVAGSGALLLGDGGFDFIAKRPIVATPGTYFSISVDINTSGWAQPGTYDLYLYVQGIADYDSVLINSEGVFTTFTLSGLSTSDSGYIRIYGANQAGHNDVWVDNVIFDDDAPPPVDPPIFADDFESGTAEWTLEGTWGTTELQAYSPTHSLTESPVGNYGTSWNISATMVNGVDLSGVDVKGADVSFMAMGSIEAGNFDYMYVEASNDGTNWSTLDAIFGEPISPVFVNFAYSLGAFIGDNDVRIRFRFFSDGGYEVDGMYIDDFMITTTDVDTVAPVIVHDGPAFYEGVPGDFGREADVIDVSGVANAEISYSVEGGTPVVISTDSVAGDIHYFTIPQQTAGSNVEYDISAEDGIGNVGTFPEIFKYISGTHWFFANPEVSFYQEQLTNTGVAVRFSVPVGLEAQIVTGLIRNYTDQSQPLPNGRMLVHVWDDNAGLPGNDLITPFLVTTEANFVETSRMTRVDFRPYSAQLSDLTGDFHIGFTVPDTLVRFTFNRPTTPAAGRSSNFAGSAWTSNTADDYHIRAIVALDSAANSVLGDDFLPVEFALNQNFPNPFNPSTTIKYALKQNVDVKLTIYNILGQEIRTLISGSMTAGYKEVVWNGLDNNNAQVSTGVYFYRIEAGDFVKSRKMIYMK